MTRGPKIAHNHPRIVPRKRTASSRLTTARINSRCCQALAKGVSRFMRSEVSSNPSRRRIAADGGDVDQFALRPSTLATHRKDLRSAAIVIAVYQKAAPAGAF